MGSPAVARKDHDDVPPSPRNHTDDAKGKKKKDKGQPKRPGGGMKRQVSVQTHYMTMLLDLDTVPRRDNILAAFLVWLLLAGYLVFPATFTSLKEKQPDPSRPTGKLEITLINVVRNAPLLWIAGICCIGAGLGMVWLAIKWRKNYIWQINRVFSPGLLNSLAGLISTLGLYMIFNVYTAQNGVFSVTARVTMIATGICCVVTSTLFLLYNFWALARVKKKHARELKLEQDVPENEGFG